MANKRDGADRKKPGGSRKVLRFSKYCGLQLISGRSLYNMIQIRQIKPDEWALLKQVRLTALSDAPNAFFRPLDEDKQISDSTWQERAMGHTSFTAVAIDADNPIGIAVGLLDSKNKAQAYLISMWVAPAYRGTGIASSLVELVESWAKEWGAETLSLGVTQSNARADAFYRKCGFETHHGIPPEHPAVSGCGSVLTKKLKQLSEQG